MREWTCECGKLLCFGSDPPKPCQTCSACGTTALKNADGTRVPPEEHEPVEEEMRRNGVVVHKRTFCQKCMERLDKK